MQQPGPTHDSKTRVVPLRARSGGSMHKLLCKRGSIGGLCSQCRRLKIIAHWHNPAKLRHLHRGCIEVIEAHGTLSKHYEASHSV